MITAKFEDKEIQVPTSWHDVPFKKLIKFLDCKTSLEQASVLLGIELEKLSLLNAESLATMLSVLSFTSELPDCYIPQSDKIDIGKGTYFQIEMVKAKLQAANKPYEALNDILIIYTGKDYLDEPCPFPYALSAFFLTRYYHSLTNTSDSENTHQQRQNN